MTENEETKRKEASFLRKLALLKLAAHEFWQENGVFGIVVAGIVCVLGAVIGITALLALYYVAYLGVYWHVTDQVTILQVFIVGSSLRLVLSNKSWHQSLFSAGMTLAVFYFLKML